MCSAPPPSDPSTFVPSPQDVDVDVVGADGAGVEVVAAAAAATGVRTRGIFLSRAVCAFARVGVTATEDVVVGSVVVGLDEMVVPAPLVVVPAYAGEEAEGER